MVKCQGRLRLANLMRFKENRGTRLTTRGGDRCEGDLARSTVYRNRVLCVVFNESERMTASPVSRLRDQCTITEQPSASPDDG